MMTFGQRFLLTLIIVIIILFALAAIGYFSGRWDEADAQGLPPLQPRALSKYEQRFLALDREAIDIAYKNQIEHLFQTWMKDERDQPARARTGATQARSAYERIMDAIAEREKRLEGRK